MDNTIKEDMMAPVVIDLTQKNELDESWLRMFGENIKGILKAMFGNVSIPLQIKGSRTDVNSFVNAMHRERDFISTLKRYGLDNPRTYKSRANLNQATSAFERQTGIKWPFK